MKHILIADDHEIVRSGLRAIIETRSDWSVSGEADNGKDAVAKTIESKPDVVIMDYSMPSLNGLEACRKIRMSGLRTEVLILTMHESDDVLEAILLAGVRGLLLKSDARHYLMSAIEALLDHRPYFSSLVLEKLLQAFSLCQNVKQTILSARERSVVQLIAEGSTNRSIAGSLDLSVKTVETYRASAMRKLGVASTAELVRYAIRTNLTIL